MVSNQSSSTFLSDISQRTSDFVRNSYNYTLQYLLGIKNGPEVVHAFSSDPKIHTDHTKIQSFLMFGETSVPINVVNDASYDNPKKGFCPLFAKLDVDQIDFHGKNFTKDVIILLNNFVRRVFVDYSKLTFPDPEKPETWGKSGKAISIFSEEIKGLRENPKEDNSQIYEEAKQSLMYSLKSSIEKHFCKEWLELIEEKFEKKVEEKIDNYLCKGFHKIISEIGQQMKTQPNGGFILNGDTYRLSENLQHTFKSTIPQEGLCFACEGVSDITLCGENSLHFKYKDEDPLRVSWGENSIFKRYNFKIQWYTEVVFDRYKERLGISDIEKLKRIFLVDITTKELLSSNQHSNRVFVLHSPSDDGDHTLVAKLIKILFEECGATAVVGDTNLTKDKTIIREDINTLVDKLEEDFGKERFSSDFRVTIPDFMITKTRVESNIWLNNQIHKGGTVCEIDGMISIVKASENDRDYYTQKSNSILLPIL